MANRIINIELTGNNSKAIKAIEGVGAAATKVGATAETRFTSASSKIGGAFNKLDGELAQFGVPFSGALGVIGTKLENTEGKAKNFGGTLASVGQVAGVAAVGGLIAVGAESLKLADSFDQAHARLVTATKNVGEALATEGEKIKGTDEKLINLGFSSTDTESSLASLIPATHDVGAATGLMGLAADIARAKNISLGEATKLLVNIEAGRLKGLAAFGIASKDAAGHTLTAAAAIQKLNAAVGGQASAYLDTYAGKQAVLAAKADEVGVKLGEVEKKAIEHVADAALIGVQGFEKLNAATDGWLGKATALGAGGLIAFGAIAKVVDITKSAAASLGLFTAAEETNTVATQANAIAADATAAAEVRLAEAGAATAAASAGSSTAVAGSLNTVATAADAAATAASKSSTEISAAATASGAAASAADAVATSKSVAAAKASVADAKLAAAADTAALANRDLSAAIQGGTASATEIVGASEAAAAAEDQLAFASANVVKAQEGVAAASAISTEVTTASFAAALGPITLVAAGIGAAALALNHFFGGNNNSGQIKELAVNLTQVGQGAQEAQAGLAKIVGSGASAALGQYANLVLANGSAADKAKAKSEALAVAIIDSGGNFTKAGNQIDTATNALDDYAKKNGLAATQTAILGAAQKRYADDLASGNASEKALADDKQAVIDASKKQATTQKTVNDAVQTGVGIAEKAAAANAAAAEKTKSAAKAQADAVKAAAREQAAAIKAYAKDLDAFGNVAGRDMEKVAHALGIPDAEIKTLTANVKSIDAAFGSSFDKATNDISQFKDKTHVSFLQFEEDELKSIQATTNWSSNLVLLARQGLSLGFIKELASAGVSSAGLVQSIEDNVNKGSIATTNSLYKTGQAAKTQAERAFAAAAIAAQSEADKINSLHPTVHVSLTGVNDAINQLAAFRGNLASLNATSSIIHFTYSGPTAPGAGNRTVRPQAAGGPVKANERLLVGEKGPELFVGSGQSKATLLGAQGPELWSPPASGDIIPNDKVKSFAARGAGSHSTIKGYADGTAPFGSYGTFSPNPITVTFASGSASSFSGGSLASASSFISNFASTYLTDFQKVTDTTANAARTAALLADAHKKYDAVVKKVNATELQLRVDLFSGKPTAANDLRALGVLYAAKIAAHDLYARLTQDRKTALGEQANARAQLKKDSNPATFTGQATTSTANLQLFQSDLSRLVGSGDPLLAKEIAGVGPDQGLPLANAFVKNLAQARLAEQALKANNAAQASLTQFETQNFRAAGGSVDPNKSYVVGEKGPEVFVPKSAGTIVPNNGEPFASHSSSRSGQGGVINITIHSTVDAISGRAVYRIVKEDQRLHGAWDIKVNAP